MSPGLSGGFLLRKASDNISHARSWDFVLALLHVLHSDVLNLTNLELML